MQVLCMFSSGLKQQLSQVEGGRSKRVKDFPGTTTKFRNDFTDDEDDDDEDGIEYHNTRTDSGIVRVTLCSGEAILNMRSRKFLFIPSFR